MKIILSLIILVYMIFGESYCNGQQDSIKLKVIDYLIEKGELIDIENKVEYLDNIYIADLVEADKLENNESSYILYKIGTFSSHSLTYLMVKKKQEYIMMDLKNIDEVLIYIINFLREKNKSPQEILDKIEAILFLYQSNLKAIPWTD
ncbi:MAG: hypothetical protein ABR519_03130 [Bacteroidales bacterium]